VFVLCVVVCYEFGLVIACVWWYVCGCRGAMSVGVEVLCLWVWSEVACLCMSSGHVVACLCVSSGRVSLCVEWSCVFVCRVVMCLCVSSGHVSLCVESRVPSGVSGHDALMP